MNEMTENNHLYCDEEMDKGPGFSQNSNLDSLKTSPGMLLKIFEPDESINFPSYDGYDTTIKKQSVSELKSDHSIMSATISLDDMELQQYPAQNVDYLSHDWREEDIQASWKHVTSTRIAYSNSLRLENSSWRVWAKIRSNILTASPESIGWMKDNDTTWLYGPLQVGKKDSFDKISPDIDEHGVTIGQKTSNTTIRPILKVPNICDRLLQRSRHISGSKAFQQPTMRDNPIISILREASLVLKKKVQFHHLVHQFIVVDIIDEDDSKGTYVAFQPMSLELDSESEDEMVDSLGSLEVNKGIKTLPSSVLKDEGDDNHANVKTLSSGNFSSLSYLTNKTWPFSLSPNTNNSATQADLIFRTPFDTKIAGSDIFELYLDNLSTAQSKIDEYFDMGLFQDIQQAKTHALDEIEQMHPSSCGISKYLSSESDEFDYDDDNEEEEGYDGTGGAVWDRLQPAESQTSTMKSTSVPFSELGFVDDMDDEANWWNNV